MTELKVVEQLIVTVTCDHLPGHSATFEGGLPDAEEVSRALKVHGCRYNGEALEGNEIFAPPPVAEVTLETNATISATETGAANVELRGDVSEVTA